LFTVDQGSNSACDKSRLQVRARPLPRR